MYNTAELGELWCRMNNMDIPLPDFADPPVVEVALSVQFEVLSKISTPQLGLLWQEFRERFPITEEHPPLEPVTERFGVPPTPRGTVRVEMRKGPPTPRCWFLNQQGTELIQIQQNRFVRNWRKVGDEGRYPRYEKHLRPHFESDLKFFHAFLQREQLGDLKPNQCEVTYVNQIVAGKAWKSHAELGEVITVFAQRYSDVFLETSEDASVRLRFVIPDDSGQPLGRLHIAIDPGYRSGDNQPLFSLHLTARGRPCGDGIDGVLRFMDLGREWVVRGFASITTSRMHKEWGRNDGN